MINLTYAVDRRCHVNVEPDSWEVEAQVGVDEEAGAGRLGVAAILYIKN